jgi:hypothetical protein
MMVERTRSFRKVGSKPDISFHHALHLGALQSRSDRGMLLASPDLGEAGVPSSVASPGLAQDSKRLAFVNRNDYHSYYSQ